MKKRLIATILLMSITMSGCSTTKSYEVTWKNYDGTILEIDKDVAIGEMPSYDGPTPTKPSTEAQLFTFDRWSPELSPVTKNTTYTALYRSTLLKAKIVFDLNGGTTSSDTSPIYVDSFDSSCFFFDVKKTFYNFRGWSYNGKIVFDQKGRLINNPPLEKKMTFVATYAHNVYLTIVTNMSEAGNVTGEGTYEYNSDINVIAQPNQGYDFVGWYYKETLLSDQKAFIYKLQEDDITIEARFKLSTYDMTVKSAHPLLGSVMIKDEVSLQESSNKKYDFLSNVCVEASSLTDKYRFLGWFDENGVLVDDNLLYSFKMPSHDYVLTAKWDAPSFNIAVSKNNERGGTIMGVGSYEYNSTVSLSQVTNSGYSFDGWYKNNIKVSSNQAYSFNMPFEDVFLEARWSIITYNISYELDGGTQNSANPTTFTVEENKTLYNPTKTGYTFTGWKLNGNKIESTEGIYEDITLTATWSINSYKVVVTSQDLSKGGVGIRDPRDSYDYNHYVMVDAIPNKGYSFLGWYGLDGSFVSSLNTYTFQMGDSDVYLEARWSIITYKISYNLNGGTQNVNNPTEYTVESNTITLLEPSCEYRNFVRWVDFYGEEVTQIAEGSSKDISLTAIWCQTDEQKTEERNTEKWKQNQGIVPTVSADKKSLTYGLYPQTHVDNEALITELNKLTNPESNGWYLYNNEYYVYATATTCHLSYFDDGTRLIPGRKYWFKCEPIEWVILSSDGSDYFLVSKYLLDAHEYNEYYRYTKNGYYANNYKNSNIRSWLNNEFYNTAFVLDDSLIQNTTVDNSLTSTCYENNQYVCEDTYDKIFLLSRKELSTLEYGFNNYLERDSTRQSRTTDYARARDLTFGTDIVDAYTGVYLTRSPTSADSLIWGVDSLTNECEFFPFRPDDVFGIRPAMHISF